MKAVRSLQRIMALADKEWIQIRRDARSLILSLIAPALLVVLFGYALNMDVKHVSITIMDQDRTAFSRQMIEKFSHTEYLQIHGYAKTYKEIDKLLNSGEASLALVIPPDFTRRVKAGRKAKLQLLVDGSDSMSSTVAAGYVQAILMEFNLDVQMKGLNRAGISKLRLPLDVRSRVWYNEELQSKNLIIPGIIVIILAIISALITSLTISREWERGTMETLITTPVRPFEVMTGKLIPYLIIGTFDVVMTFLVGYFFFGIYLRGSFIELLLLSVLFLIGTSTLGILISSVTKVQVLSIQAAVVVTYLPSFILSGFVFPIQNMPMVIQAITYLIPAKYMITIIKGIVLKGTAASLLATQIVFMAVFAVVAVLIGIRKFRLTIND
ncbi:MAG: hypothetical protein CVV44_09440 [Spirochaetae bacterium HGW-Spirochaetae-1]|jgi:ABC-2 type transport system permease protein|nr:MAG: hypothetical protein CVV44_09440 [Spirochaetae bacterium HGW-Spirochaetae-1]